MKPARKLPGPAAAALLALGYLLMLLLPAGAARLGDAKLLSGTVPRPVMEGQLSARAQEIPLIYALYRSRVLSGGEDFSQSGEAATPEQARSLSGTLGELEDAGVLPGFCREAAGSIFDLPGALAYTGREKGFVQKSYQGYDASGNARSVLVQQQEETGLVTVCTLSSPLPAPEGGEKTDPERILKQYRAYLGLDGLTGWQEAGRGENSAVCWSAEGQIYLYCTVEEERFALGAVSLPPEELEAIAAGLA